MYIQSNDLRTTTTKPLKITSTKSAAQTGDKLMR